MYFRNSKWLIVEAFRYTAIYWLHSVNFVSLRTLVPAESTLLGKWIVVYAINTRVVAIRNNLGVENDKQPGIMVNVIRSGTQTKIDT